MYRGWCTTPPGRYQGHPGAMWGWSHPWLAGARRLTLPGTRRPQRQGCRTRSAGERAWVAPRGARCREPWVAGGRSRSGTTSPSPTLLWSRASEQSVISVKSFMVVGNSQRSLAGSFLSTLCPLAQLPVPPPAPPQLPPLALGWCGHPHCTRWGRGGGSTSCAYLCHPSSRPPRALRAMRAAPRVPGAPGGRQPGSPRQAPCPSPR